MKSWEKKMKDSISLHINREGLKDNSKKTSRSKVVGYRMKGSDEWNTGKIMSTQPKLAEKYSHWLNIEPEVVNKIQICINWVHVDLWRELPLVTEQVSDQEYVVLLTSEQGKTKEVVDAKNREIENIEIHGVYKCVLDNCQKCVSTKWIIMEEIQRLKEDNESPTCCTWL